MSEGDSGGNADLLAAYVGRRPLQAGDPRPYIGIILDGNTDPPSMGDPDGANIRGFEKAMTALDYHFKQKGDTKTQNCWVWARSTGTDPFSRMGGPPATLANIVTLMMTNNHPPDMIIVTVSQIARAVRLQTNTIPIIMATDDGDCVAAGLVNSLIAPGTNLTGMTSVFSFLTGELLKLFAKKWGAANISPLEVLWNPDVLDKDTDWTNLNAAVGPLGVKLANGKGGAAGQIRQLSDITGAVGALKAAGAVAIFTLGDALTFRGRKDIITEIDKIKSSRSSRWASSNTTTRWSTRSPAMWRPTVSGGRRVGQCNGITSGLSSTTFWRESSISVSSTKSSTNGRTWPTLQNYPSPMGQ